MMDTDGCNMKLPNQTQKILIALKEAHWFMSDKYWPQPTGIISSLETAIKEIERHMTTINPSTPAELYDCYCLAVGGKSFNGDPLPAWSVFRNDSSKKTQADAWEKVAEYANENAKIRINAALLSHNIATSPG